MYSFGHYYIGRTEQSCRISFDRQLDLDLCLKSSREATVYLLSSVGLSSSSVKSMKTDVEVLSLNSDDTVLSSSVS